jgi:hypothetical protein
MTDMVTEIMPSCSLKNIAMHLSCRPTSASCTMREGEREEREREKRERGRGRERERERQERDGHRRQPRSADVMQQLPSAKIPGTQKQSGLLAMAFIARGRSPGDR